MPSSLNGTGVTFNDGTQLNSKNEAGGNYIQRTYTSPATWTKPAGLKAVKVTVVGGGGGGGGTRGCDVDNPRSGGTGSPGGTAIEYISAPSIPGPVAVTVGAGGSGGPAPGTVCSYTAGGAGGTSSFGSFLSATGGLALNGGPASAGNQSGGGNGSGSGGDINIFGVGGFGGNGPFTSTPNSNGTPGFNVSTGGQGAFQSASPSPRSGGNGKHGIVLVEEFY
jgi:hypothetical protein